MPLSATPASRAAPFSVVVARQIIAVHGTQGHPGCQGNAVGDPADGPVAEGGVNTAGMPAAGGIILLVSRSRGCWHERVSGVSEPAGVDLVRRRRVGREKRMKPEEAVVVVNVAAPVVVFRCPGPQVFRH